MTTNGKKNIFKNNIHAAAELFLKELNGGCRAWNLQAQDSSSTKNYAVEGFKSTNQHIHTGGTI